MMIFTNKHLHHLHLLFPAVQSTPGPNPGNLPRGTIIAVAISASLLLLLILAAVLLMLCLRHKTRTMQSTEFGHKGSESTSSDKKIELEEKESVEDKLTKTSSLDKHDSHHPDKEAHYQMLPLQKIRDHTTEY